MSKRKRNEDVYVKISKKKRGEKDTEKEDGVITVELLSVQIEGNTQKHSRVVKMFSSRPYK